MAKEKKVSIKLKRKHSAGQMRLGRHMVKRIAQNFELNESELKELEGKGPKHWFEVGPALKEAKVKPVAKPVEEEKSE